MRVKKENNKLTFLQNYLMAFSDEYVFHGVPVKVI